MFIADGQTYLLVVCHLLVVIRIDGDQVIDDVTHFFLFGDGHSESWVLPGNGGGEYQLVLPGRRLDGHNHSGCQARGKVRKL